MEEDCRDGVQGLSISQVVFQLLVICVILWQCFGCGRDRINWWLNGCHQKFFEAYEED